MSEVSGNRPQAQDRFEKIKSNQTKAVGLAMITEPEPVGLISCNCGWQFIHARKKVREDRAEAHVNKKHGGQAAWM